MSLIFRAPLLTLVVLALLVFGIERLIVTDSEQIERLAEEASEAIRSQAWERLAGLLHEDFTYEQRDGPETVEHVRRLVKKYKPTDVGIALFEIEVVGEEARARGVVRGTALGRPARVPESAWFKETDDGWKLWKVRGGGYVR